jgi:excisionase family DNA binding protein
LTDGDPPAADPWMTLAEIADELRVNPATVRLWVSKGQLKASRAGARKWIVRRSELERMLAETNLTPDEVLEQIERGGPVRSPVAPPRRPDTDPEPDPAPAPPRKPRTAKAEGAVELLRLATSAYERAMGWSAGAPPSPGYVDRIRAVADACEHVAATMLNASETAGVRWRSKTDIADGLPYELRPGGNRPGPAERWEEFDAAFDRLGITATGTDIVAVAHGFREVWDALRRVADTLDADEQWQAWEQQAQ